MPDLSDQTITAALDGLRTGLEADGYELLAHPRGDALSVEIKATPDACEDCLVPKELMAQLIASALKITPEQIELRYPNET